MKWWTICNTYFMQYSLSLCFCNDHFMLFLYDAVIVLISAGDTYRFYHELPLPLAHELRSLLSVKALWMNIFLQDCELVIWLEKTCFCAGSNDQCSQCNVSHLVSNDASLPVRSAIWPSDFATSDHQELLICVVRSHQPQPLHNERRTSITISSIWRWPEHEKHWLRCWLSWLLLPWRWVFSSELYHRYHRMNLGKCKIDLG